jgi:hypothetical protein
MKYRAHQTDTGTFRRLLGKFGRLLGRPDPFLCRRGLEPECFAPTDCSRSGTTALGSVNSVKRGNARYRAPATELESCSKRSVYENLMARRSGDYGQSCQVGWHHKFAVARLNFAVTIEHLNRSSTTRYVLNQPSVVGAIRSGFARGVPSTQHQCVTVGNSGHLEAAQVA